MKIFLNKAFNIIIFLLFSISGFSASDPPAPNTPDGVDPPPDMPIDENLVILALTALLFGLYTIYRHKLNRKTPI
jgi:hypothetical protein